MPTAVQCLIDDHQAYAVARVVGVLDLTGAAAVRSALFGCLADQPEALLVDLSEMRLADPSALSIFPAVAQQARRWPAVPLVLCAARTDAAELLRLGSVDQQLRVVASVDDAVRSLGRCPAVPSISEELLPLVGAGRRARELVTEACFEWDLPDLVGPACTVVTEFVNNVVAHAHTMMTLRLSLRDPYLHIAVRDGSPAEPAPRKGVSLTSLSGRGLLLVDAVCRSWGSLPTTDGKVVWAVLDVAPHR